MGVRDDLTAVIWDHPLSEKCCCNSGIIFGDGFTYRFMENEVKTSELIQAAGYSSTW